MRFLRHLAGAGFVFAVALAVGGPGSGTAWADPPKAKTKVTTKTTTKAPPASVRGLLKSAEARAAHARKLKKRDPYEPQARTSVLYELKVFWQHRNRNGEVVSRYTTSDMFTIYYDEKGDMVRIEDGGTEAHLEAMANDGWEYLNHTVDIISQTPW